MKKILAFIRENGTLVGICAAAVPFILSAVVYLAAERYFDFYGVDIMMVNFTSRDMLINICRSLAGMVTIFVSFLLILALSYIGTNKCLKKWKNLRCREVIGCLIFFFISLIVSFIVIVLWIIITVWLKNKICIWQFMPQILYCTKTVELIVLISAFVFWLINKKFNTLGALKLKVLVPSFIIVYSLFFAVITLVGVMRFQQHLPQPHTLIGGNKLVIAKSKSSGYIVRDCILSEDAIIIDISKPCSIQEADSNFYYVRMPVRIDDLGQADNMTLTP